MRRTRVSLLLTIVFMFLLTACGGTATTSTTPNGTTGTGTTANPTDTTGTTGSAVQITILSNFTPDVARGKIFNDLINQFNQQSEQPAV